MAIYAVHDGITVVNVVVAESADIAESVTGCSAIPVMDNVPAIGWSLVDGEWVEPVTPGDDGLIPVE